jgi:hypothetical protein
VWDVEVLDNCFGAGHIEFAGRVHEVELRVDVPEEQSRRHGRDLGRARLFQLDSLVRRAGLSPSSSCPIAREQPTIKQYRLGKRREKPLCWKPGF